MVLVSLVAQRHNGESVPTEVRESLAKQSAALLAAVEYAPLKTVLIFQISVVKHFDRQPFMKVVGVRQVV